MSNRGDDPKGLELDFHKLIDTNVLGNIHFYNLFMPLILKGKTKKVICISSGMADLELCNNYEIETGSLYSISKAAMNAVTAKFNAQYKKDGVLFLSICPGMVDVGNVNPAERMNKSPLFLLIPLPRLSPLLKIQPDQTNKFSCTVNPHQLAALQSLLGKFTQYAPHFKGPATPDSSIKSVINVWENASIEKGNGGAFLSHLGSKQWL